MKKLAEKHRKLLRKIFLGIGAAATALGIQGCWFFPAPKYGMPDAPEYGMPYPEQDVVIQGQVLSAATDKPITGINVSLQNNASLYDRTSITGYFYIYAPRQDSFVLEFEDVDGPFNGGLFQRKEKEISLTDTDTSFKVYLTEVTEENTEEQE